MKNTTLVVCIRDLLHDIVCLVKLLTWWWHVLPAMTPTISAGVAGSQHGLNLNACYDAHH